MVAAIAVEISYEYLSIPYTLNGAAAIYVDNCKGIQNHDLGSAADQRGAKQRPASFCRNGSPRRRVLKENLSIQEDSY